MRPVDDTLITSARKRRKVGGEQQLQSPAKMREAGCGEGPSGRPVAEREGRAAGGAAAGPASEQQQQQQQPLEAHRENDAPHPLHAAHGETDEGDGVLFSPGFHTIAHAPAPQQRPAKQQQQQHKPVAAQQHAPAGDEHQTVSNASTHTSSLQVVPEVTSTTGSLEVAAAGATAIAARACQQAQQQAQLAADGFDDEDEDDLGNFFDPFLFIKNLPPLEQCFPLARKTLLPRQTRSSKQKTLVLDLDETLVHSSLDNFDAPDFTFPVEVQGVVHSVHVRKRPHLAQFLAAASAAFEVVVFTASQRVYAEQLLNVIDPQRQLIKYRLYRDECVYVDGNYLKDLSVLGRDLAHTVIVDNSPQAFGFQLANGIPIESWYDNNADRELLHLMEFLNHLSGVQDVRPLICSTFKLHQLVAAAR